MHAFLPPFKRQRPATSQVVRLDLFNAKPISTGEPLFVPIDRLDEDPNNPRTEFSEAEITTLADDIGQRGVLQPIIVDAADSTGRHRVAWAPCGCALPSRPG